MNSYEKIYNLLTEVQDQKQRTRNMWMAYRDKPNMLKALRDPQHPTNREASPHGEALHQMLGAGRGEGQGSMPGNNPNDNAAQYGGVAAGYKRNRDIAKRNRLKKEREPAPEPTKPTSLLDRIKARFKGNR